MESGRAPSLRGSQDKSSLLGSSIRGSRVRVLVVGLTLCLTVAPIAAASEAVAAQSAAAPSTEAALTGLDDFVAETLARWNAPGVAIAIVKDGKVVVSKGYGVRNPLTRAPMGKDTIFPIGSLSKAFTSFGAGLLVDEGRMSLDAPVSTYLPGISLKDAAASSGLTLRDMLSHRSGLPLHDHIWFHNAALTPDQLLGRMAHLEPSAPLRAKYQYNNNMVILAGLAVEKAAGKPFEEFLTQRIFIPLEMRRTTFSPVEARSDDNHIAGIEVLHGKRTDVPMFRNTRLLNPAGGLYSSVGDLTHWMLTQLNGGTFKDRRIIQPATLADIHRPHMVTDAKVRDPEVVSTSYGLGWGASVYRGRQMVSHNGALPGATTSIMLVPNEQIGVTVLTNLGSSELPQALSRAIVDRLLAASGKDWTGEALARRTAAEASGVSARQNKAGSRVPGTEPSHALADYAGSYFEPGYGPLSISVSEGRLTGKFNDDTSPLVHWHYDVFDAATADINVWHDLRLQFLTDPAGRISAVQILMEPAVAPIVFEKQPEARLSDPALPTSLGEPQR